MPNPDAKLVAETLLHYKSCLIATHINPEGDAIGSMLALALVLEAQGINVICFDKHGVPENCRFLPTWERVVQSLPEVLPPLVIYVDADRIERCGIEKEELLGVETYVRIDHHVSEAEPAGPSFVSTKAAAAGELVFALLPLLSATLTPRIATCLLTALMVDTGRFCYSNTTATTHHIAAELVSAQADLSTIVDWIWGRVTFAASKLMGLALSSVQLTAQGRIAWAVLRNEDFQTADATPEDSEGIIDHIRRIDGTEVAILFTEKRGVVRASVRSRGNIDAAALARRFGGGGHVKAAGMSFDGPIEFAVCQVLKAVEEQFAGTG